MLGLGIESTAHTFSCAIIKKEGKKGKILSDAFNEEENIFVTMYTG